MPLISRELSTLTSLILSWSFVFLYSLYYTTFNVTGVILCIHPANERWSYIVTLSVIGWAHTQNDPWCHQGLSVQDSPQMYCNPWLKILYDYYNLSLCLSVMYITVKDPTMVTSSNGTIFCINGPLWGVSTSHRWFPSQRLVTRSFDIVFDLHLIKWLSKQSRCQWFETPLCLLWCQCNGCRV